MPLETRTIPVTLSYSNLFSKLEELLIATRKMGASEEIADIKFSPSITWAHSPGGPVKGECFDFQVITKKRVKEGYIPTLNGKEA